MYSDTPSYIFGYPQLYVWIPPVVYSDTPNYVLGIVQLYVVPPSIMLGVHLSYTFGYFPALQLQLQLQKPPGMAGGMLGNFFRGAGYDYFAAAVAAFQPHVYDVVSVFYYIHIMLYYDYGIAFIY